MLGIVWRFLFGGCDHKWVIIDQGNIVDEESNTIGRYYNSRCEKCGKIRGDKIY